LSAHENGKMINVAVAAVSRNLVQSIARPAVNQEA
jgi:hypothetical protein